MVNLLYLGGFFAHPVVSFPEFNHILCSVGIKISHFCVTLNINRIEVNFFKASKPQGLGTFPNRISTLAMESGNAFNLPNEQN